MSDQEQSPEFYPRPPGWTPESTFTAEVAEQLGAGIHSGSGRCQAWSSGNGRQCLNPAIAGADKCRYHGAGAPQVRAAAAERVAQQQTDAKARKAVARLGLARDIEPHQALLEELHQTAGLVGWLRSVIDTDDDAAIDTDSAQWRAWDTQRAHLIRVAKTCIDAGIAERHVRLAEQQGALIADLFRRVFDDPELGLTDSQREVVGRVTRRHLELIARAG